MLKKIIKITKPYWQRLFLGIILGASLSIITGAIAWLVKPALDVIFVDKRYEYLKIVPLGIILLFTIKGVIQFWYEYLMKSSAMKLIRDMQNKLHSHFLYIPVGYFQRESSGVIISRVINDVRVLSTLFTEVIQNAIVQIPTIIVLFGIALYRKWDLTLLSILLIPFVAYSTRKFGKRVKKRSLEAQKKLSYLTQRLGETVIGSKVIKVFNKESSRDKKFIEENKRVYRENVKVIKLRETTKLLIDVITGAAIGLVLWYGGKQVMAGTITSGDFASIITAIFLMFKPVKKLGETYTFLQEIRAALERIESVLDTKKEEAGQIQISELRDGIRFENVFFTHETGKTPVLRNINLEIKTGEVVALLVKAGVERQRLLISYLDFISL